MQLSAENSDMLLTAINARIDPIVRQLERMDERVEARTRNLATRDDLVTLRKELITKDAFDPQLSALTVLIARIDHDRTEDRKELNARIDKVENDQLSRQERLWLRISQVGGVLALALALFDLLTHLKFLP